ILAMVVAAVTTGDVLIVGVGGWSLAILAVGLGALWMVSRHRNNLHWRPGPEPGDGAQPQSSERPLRPAIPWQAGQAAVGLVAGCVLAKAGEAMAEITGLGGQFVGASLVAVATSLPEVSTIVAAVHLRRYSRALGDIFGTNIFDLLLIFTIDVAYSGPPVL